MDNKDTKTEAASQDGGYDAGYRSCSCFWGREPGSVLRSLQNQIDFRAAETLDAGCGEGKNAVWLAARGSRVTAVDVSRRALANAARAWPESEVKWIEADITEFEMPPQYYDIIIAYGLMHCLTKELIHLLIDRFQNVTKIGGIHVIVTFNDRYQDLAGHPEFKPTLMSHQYYTGRYLDWEVLLASDKDLFETHPHNNIHHTHSMTRIAARKLHA